MTITFHSVEQVKWTHPKWISQAAKKPHPEILEVEVFKELSFHPTIENFMNSVTPRSGSLSILSENFGSDGRRTVSEPKIIGYPISGT